MTAVGAESAEKLNRAQVLLSEMTAHEFALHIMALLARNTFGRFMLPCSFLNLSYQFCG
jgi:hypothetical protein